MAKILKTDVIKRSLNINGRNTSISLENEFWAALREIASRTQMSVPALVKQIDKNRTTCNLSSAIRTFVFAQLGSANQRGRLWSSASFRARAEECRNLAESFRDEETGAIMLRIATDYDRMSDLLDAGYGQSPVQLDTVAVK